MQPRIALFLTALFCCCLPSIRVNAAGDEPPSSARQNESGVRSFAVNGVIRELGTDSRTVLVQHDAVAGYMPAMTMHFKVQESKELAGLRAGDRISFQLRVTDTESWIDDITRIGTLQMSEQVPPIEPLRTQPERSRPRHPLLDFKFTNELDRPVALGDFRGQALAITFFFTRCPIPDYCPRLSKNFQEAAKRLNAVPGGPTNWHFLSVSFDTEFDTPGVLKAYGEMYHYDPTHWSFLTGPAERIGQLARLSDVTFERDGASFNHNFRTLIIDTTGHPQMVFPTGGDLSVAIVEEILKAAAVTNESVSDKLTGGQEHEANQKRQDSRVHDR
jgi:protein SCO1/2